MTGRPRTTKKSVTGYLSEDEVRLWKEIQEGYGTESDAETIRKLMRDKVQSIRSGQVQLDILIESSREVSAKLDVLIALHRP